MLNRFLKPSDKIFADAVEKKPIRDGYGEGLLVAGEKDKNVVVLCADLSESTRAYAFAKKFPERFFQVGVAEQNMATIATGLAVSGKIPFISSYAAFSPGRNWEQIRTTISYNNTNVKIAGHHAGISVGPDGATHQAVEDIATMRVMANMTVIVPCDAAEAKRATMMAAKIDGPVYMRFAREKTPLITEERTPFSVGRAEIFWESKHPAVAIIACGVLVHGALLAAKALEEEGISTVVINNHTVKPMDEKTILRATRQCGAVVTVEEHQISGGMGSAVAETLSSHFPVPMEFVGMRNVFGESGRPEELIEKYGMGVSSIISAVKKVIKRK